MLFAVPRLFLEAIAKRLTSRSTRLEKNRAFSECYDRSGTQPSGYLHLRLWLARLLGRSSLELSS